MTRRTRTVLALAVVLIVGAVAVKVVYFSPQRVLLAGDSILRQTGPALDDTFGRNVSITNAAVNDSGLLTPGYVNWHRRLAREVDEHHPDVVVLQFIGNYTDTDLYVDEHGVSVQKNTPQFFAAWEHEADRLMRVLKDSDAAVYWMLPPPEASPANQATTAGLRQVYEDLARRWPRIHLIDANDALAGPNGEYLPRAENQDGKVVPLRVSDTVHLTDAGARRLARVIHDGIEPSL